jgi:hypothetical protein
MVHFDLRMEAPITGNFHTNANVILLPEWMEHHTKPQNWWKDAYCLQAEYILMKHQPYIGDEKYDHMWETINSRDRFHIGHSKRKGYYRIQDNLTGFVIKVESRLLAQPDFQIINWYNQKRAKHFNTKVMKRPARDAKIGDAIARVAKHALEDGILACYPNISPPDGNSPRFEVFPETTKRKVYIVKDRDLNLEFKIPRATLANPELRMAEWYMDRIAMNNAYNTAYTGRLQQLQERILAARGYVSKPLSPTLCTPLSDEEIETTSSLPGLRVPTATSNDGTESLPGLELMSEL